MPSQPPESQDNHSLPLSSKPTESHVSWLGKLEGNEAARRVEVVFSGVVHDAHVVAAGRCEIRDDAIETPHLEVVVGAGIDAEQVGGRDTSASRGNA